MYLYNIKLKKTFKLNKYKMKTTNLFFVIELVSSLSHWFNKLFIQAHKIISLGIALTTVFFLPSLWEGSGIGCFAQNVGINSSGALPDSSAGLDISSTNKGLLIPRVALTSTLDVFTIPSPATSLLVYNNTLL